MAIAAEIRESLEREYNICSKAIHFYKQQIKAFEKKHMTDTRTFLERFEAGTMGDDEAFFDWYAFHKILTSWTKTKNALQTFMK